MGGWGREGERERERDLLIESDNSQLNARWKSARYPLTTDDGVCGARWGRGILVGPKSQLNERRRSTR